MKHENDKGINLSKGTNAYITEDSNSGTNLGTQLRIKQIKGLQEELDALAVNKSEQRNKPLDQCGLIITISVGVKDLDMEQAESYFSDIIYNNKCGIDGVKFFKEYFTMDFATNKTEITISII